MRIIISISLALSMLGCGSSSDFLVSDFEHQDIRVLDGDTLIFEGAHVRLSGIDAPELGPWAKCWAEAALAGSAKSYIETALYENATAGKWKLADVSKDAALNLKRARLVRSDGEDLAESLVVYGYAAKTSGKWDWCGEKANLHSVRYDEPEPHGPNLWWPSGSVFDERAAD